MARGAGADRSRGSGAPREPRTERAGGRADAAAQSDRQWVGDVRVSRPRAGAGDDGVVDHGARLAGRAVAGAVQGRLARAHARLLVVAEQIETLNEEQRAAVAAAPAESALGRLVRVKGVATTSASTLLDEGLIWRDFQNRREVGGLLGFARAHYDSGETQRDQGISRAGNCWLSR